MKTLKVRVTDGRYLINHPDCIIISNRVRNLYVSAKHWNEYTNNAIVKPYVRGQQLVLTDELIKAFQKVQIEMPQVTNNTKPSDLKENTCTRCGGLGKIEAYSHINNGICFECNGTGQVN